MKVTGCDGIARELNEHYDGIGDVEQDPFGAHRAIQDLWVERDQLRRTLQAVRMVLKNLDFKDDSIAIEGIDLALSQKEGQTND